MKASFKAEKETVGFGGANVRSVATIFDSTAQGDVVFYGVNCEIARVIGVSNPGSAVHIRRTSARMAPWTRVQAPHSHDIGVLCSPRDEAMAEIIGLAASLARAGRRPVLVGCDHAASYIHAIGNAAAGAFVYLYFDAHFDLGLHGGPGGIHNGNFVSALARASDISKVVNVGGRSWSTFSEVYRRTPLRFSSVRGTKAADLIKDLSFLKGQRVYVSIDADVLDPAFAPNVCCPEPLGMNPEELLAVCAWLGRHCTVVGGDLCELLPVDSPAQAEQALLRSVHALFAVR